LIRCLLAAVLFGVSAPAASVLAGDVPALALAGLLYLGAALAVAPAALRHPRPVQDLRRGGWLLMLAIVFGGAIGPVLLVLGLERVPASSASLLLNCELPATAVLAWLVFHEHLGRRFVTATALVIGAGVLLVWSGGTFELGGLFIVAACVAWAVDNSATARIDQLSPGQITFAKGAVAGSANLALGLALGSAWHPTTGQVLAALAVGAFGYGLSITLWVKGARDLGAARGQVIFATAPFVGALVSWTVLGESVAVYQLVAVALAAVGVALSLDTAHGHRHHHDPLEHEHEHRHDDDHHDHRHDPPVLVNHTHRHRHDALDHEHAHVPDLHHGHRH